MKQELCYAQDVASGYKTKITQYSHKRCVQLTGYIGQRPYGSSRTANDVSCNRPTLKRKKDRKTL